MSNDNIDINELGERRGQAMATGATEDSNLSMTEPLLEEPAADGVTEVADNAAEASGRGEGVGQALEVQGKSQNQIVRERFFRHKGAMAGLFVICAIALLAFSSMGLTAKLHGWYYIHDHAATMDIVNDARPTLKLPVWLGGDGGAWFQLGAHPFGQDNIGRDNFALVMKGIQTSLLVVVCLGMVATLIGVTVGALAGYYRGTVDMILMRLTDMVITLPVIVIGSVLGIMINRVPDKMGLPADAKNDIRAWIPLFLGVALGCILWPGLARLTRSEFLGLREREFVDSARVSGASDRRIIFKHMLPNAVGVVIVQVTLLMSAAVVLETALSFLGFGISPPQVSLGNLIAEYQGAFATRPWLFWWPGLFIILIALSVNFIGDGLRDAFDPRTKRIPSKRQMDRAEKIAEVSSVAPTTKEEK